MTEHTPTEASGWLPAVCGALIAIVGLMMIANVDWRQDLINGVLGALGLVIGVALMIQGWRCSKKSYQEKRNG
ncbi:hypothetical protein [Uliginosibacterium gangwonense]|uniref:hypothetical protein n=1 Tax=Uliginosibacterium gangwonense TaxID=392736 RepID=UPI0003707204|nr:hypothetical protein [Uliginosibacterium gangwonense]